ncbi:MAG: extensin family protein [Aurantimonas endophytica]|uniref:extensin-like domain-containing protein n=1 Tax=Aurantimonas endophytica TaxID=1522175 RepID=UPI003001B224
MVPRKRVWRIAALAVALAAASHLPGALAQSDFAPVPPAAVPGGEQLMWGGRLPAPGEGYVPSAPRLSDQGYEALVDHSMAQQGAAPSPPPAPADDGWSLTEDLLGGGAQAAAPPPAMQSQPMAAPPPLAAPVSIDDLAAGQYEPALPQGDPWAGLKEAEPQPAPPPPPVAPAPAPQRAVAALEPAPVRPEATVPGRGALEDQTPTGYRAMPRAEAQCRATLRKMGVQFVDVAPIGKGRGCGIPHPVKITAIAEGVAMKPAATLNCASAVRISKWVEDEVKPAARWKMWKRPTAVLNASSYRCSRIAGSRTVSEHATGNALDVRGFQFSDGSLFDVEKKGFFSFRQKSFQSAVRESACRYFGTVLGPGYNHAHRDHLHLDAKNRRRVVCK